MIARSALLSVGGFLQTPDMPAVDVPTLLGLAQLDGNVRYSPHHLGDWRLHGDQTTQVLSVECARGTFSVGLQYLQSNPEFPVSIKQFTRTHYRFIAHAYLNALLVRLREGSAFDHEELLEGLWRYGGPARRLRCLQLRAVRIPAFRRNVARRQVEKPAEEGNADESGHRRPL